jgi:hypothetical protein
MALIVFLRGINVGGHRRLRPSILAKELGAYDVVNVRAAGTLVVKNPGPRADFLSSLRRKLPIGAVVAFCDGRDLLRLEMEHPFKNEQLRPDLVQFVSVLSKAGRSKSFVSGGYSRGWRVVRKNHRLKKQACVWSISPSHEDDRASWPYRRDLWWRPPRPVVGLRCFPFYGL